MAFAFKNVSNLSNVTSTPATPAFSGGNTAGSVIVVFAVSEQNATGVEFITSITDSQLNTYVQAGTVRLNNAFSDQWSCWVANNIAGGGGANTITINYSAGTRVQAQAVEYSGQAASGLVDTFAGFINTGSLTNTYNVMAAAAGELIVSFGFCDASPTNSYSALSGTARTGLSVVAQFIMDAVSTLGSNSVSQTISANSSGSISVLLNPAASTFSITGNAGTAGATVSWSGTASGSTTADGSGNYTIPNLANGPYTITPSKTGFVFSPVNSSQTVSGANITGVNFTASVSNNYSVPDCRLAPFGPNSSRSVQGTLIYDKQTGSNAAVPGKDSRVQGAPIDSRVASIIPQNSRTAGTYGPGE